MFLYHKSFDWRLLQYSRSCLLASSADPPALIPCKKKIKNQAQLFVQGLNSDVRTRNKRTLKPTQKRLSSQTVFPEQLFGDLVPIVYVWEHGTHPVQTQQTFFFFSHKSHANCVNPCRVRLTLGGVQRLSESKNHPTNQRTGLSSTHAVS